MWDIPQVSPLYPYFFSLDVDVFGSSEWVLWEQNNHMIVTFQAAVDGRRDPLITVSVDDSPLLSFSRDGQPMAWVVARGNRWTVTKNALTWEEYLEAVQGPEALEL